MFVSEIRKEVRRDTSVGDMVKSLVLDRWEQYKEVRDKTRERVELTEESQANKQKIEEPKIIKLKARAEQKGPSLIKPWVPKGVPKGAFSVKPWLPRGA